MTAPAEATGEAISSAILDRYVEAAAPSLAPSAPAEPAVGGGT